MRQSTRSGDHASGDHPAVAVAQHDGQRDQAHRNDGCSHHARGGGQQGAHQNHRDGQAAAHRTKHLTHCFQQVFGHARAFQQDAHEGEEGNGQQGVVLHDAEDAQGQGLEHGGWKETRLHADEAKPETACGQGKRHRKAGDQQGQQARKHQGYKVLHQKRGFHHRAPWISCCSSAARFSSSLWLSSWARVSGP